MYFLIDLERSIGSGIMTYWKSNSRGYTRDINEGGLYVEEVAKKLVESDFDKRTVMVHEDVVKKIVNLSDRDKIRNAMIKQTIHENYEALEKLDD